MRRTDTETQDSEEGAEDTWEASVIFQGGLQTHRDQGRPGDHTQRRGAGDNEVRSAECDQNVWNNNTRAVYSGPRTLTPRPGPSLCPPSAGRSWRCFLTAGHFLPRNTITSLSRHKLLVIFPSTEILFVHHQHPRKYDDRNVCKSTKNISLLFGVHLVFQCIKIIQCTIRWKICMRLWE